MLFDREIVRDIDDVSLVINYDMPVPVTFEPDYETYLRQIGRCGCFGKLGTYISLISYSNIRFFSFDLCFMEAV